MKEYLIIIIHLITGTLVFSQGHIDSLRTDGVYIHQYDKDEIEHIGFLRFMDEYSVVVGEFPSDSIAISEIGEYCNTYYGLQRGYGKFYSYDSVVIWRYNKPELLILSPGKEDLKLAEIQDLSGRNFTIGPVRNYSFYETKFQSSIDSGDLYVYRYTSDMPCFKGCETILNKNVKFICTQIKLYHFFYALDWVLPDVIIDDHEDTYRVEFIVEKDGSLSNIEILGKNESYFRSKIRERIDEISEKELFYPGSDIFENKRTIYNFSLSWRNSRFNSEMFKPIDFGEEGEFLLDRFDGKIYINNEEARIQDLNEIEKECFSRSFKYKEWVWQISDLRKPVFYFDCF